MWYLWLACIHWIWWRRRSIDFPRLLHLPHQQTVLHSLTRLAKPKRNLKKMLVNTNESLYFELKPWFHQKKRKFTLRLNFYYENLILNLLTRLFFGEFGVCHSISLTFDVISSWGQHTAIAWVWKCAFFGVSRSQCTAQEEQSGNKRIHFDPESKNFIFSNELCRKNPINRRRK